METKFGRKIYRIPTIAYNKSNPIKYHVVIGKGYTIEEIGKELNRIVERLEKKAKRGE